MLPVQDVVQVLHWRLDVAVQGKASYWLERQAVQVEHCGLLLSEQVPLRKNCDGQLALQGRQTGEVELVQVPAR